MRWGGIDSLNSKTPGVWDATEHKRGQDIAEVETET